MQFSATGASTQEFLSWRDYHRDASLSPNIHDWAHAHAGWTLAYLLKIDNTTAGGGFVGIEGPWANTRTLLDFHILPECSAQISRLFSAFVAASGATHFEVQAHDKQLTALLHVSARSSAQEELIFCDKSPTALPGHGTIIHRFFPTDAEKVFPHQHQSVGDWVLEVDSVIAATGRILDHTPYGDIHLEVHAPCRGRGLGSYLIQELKRVCYDSGLTPRARCAPTNAAAVLALHKAGFAPNALVLTGQMPVLPKSSLTQRLSLKTVLQKQPA